MDIYTVALFGEAEKGDFKRAHHFNTIPQLLECLGHPPAESRGIYCAIQALLYQRELLYFRVREEGFSYEDYLLGLKLLLCKDLVQKLAAVCLPGVGDAEILDAIEPVCQTYHSIIITNASDFYDYLSDR